MQTNSPHQQFYTGHCASRGNSDTGSTSRRRTPREGFTGLIPLFNPAQLCLLLADPRQRLTLPVKLGGRLADAGFKATLVSRQRSGINPGLSKLGALALYRLPEPVIFELQVSSGFFAASIARACALVGFSVF